jgi:hypothetical protein
MNKRLWLTLCVTVLISAFISTPAQATGPWTPETQVTAAGQTTTQAPQILRGSDSSLTSLTVETVNSVYSILSRRSTDGGATWSTPTLLSATGVATAGLSVLRLTSGVFVIAWAEASGASNVNRIRLTTSADNGQTWTTTRTVSDADSNPWPANEPHLAQFGLNDVAIGFQQSDGSNNIAVVRNSSSSFQNWSAGRRLSATGSDAKHVTPVVNSNGDIVVSWVLLTGPTKQSQIAGSTNWSNVTTLSSFPTGGLADREPAVVATSLGTFVVLWADPNGSSGPSFTVKARKSSDVGQSWSTAVDVSFTAYPEAITAVATPDGEVTAVWDMGTGGYTYLQSSHSSAASTTWQAPVTFTASATGQYYNNPHLALSSDGTLGVSFSQNVGSTSAPAFLTSSTNGTSWDGTADTVSGWMSGSESLGQTSVTAMNSQGFAVSWQTLNTFNPAAGFVRVNDWSAPPPSPSPAPSLATTGFSAGALPLLSGALLAGGVLFLFVSARTRPRR